MSNYSIDNYNFSNWSGPPPRLVNEHLRTFTKPGQPGVSGQLLGVHGDAFDIELHAAFPDQPSLILAENGYRFLIGQSPLIVVYNGINYFSRFQHKYLILAVAITEQKRMVRMIDASPTGYDYYGGWMLKSRWQLLPVT